MKILIKVALAFPIPCLVTALAALPSFASILATGGNIYQFSSLSSVELNQIQSDTAIIAFNEKQNVLLPDVLRVDITEPGSYRTNILSPTSISGGRLVSSHFLHYDPIRDDEEIKTASGWIRFDQTIIGVIVTNLFRNNDYSYLLDRSDFLGAIRQDGTSTIYPEPGNENRGFDRAALESITISDDRQTLSVNFSVTNEFDQIRVITADVPEPLTLLGSSLALGFGAWFKINSSRRSKKAS